MAVLPLYVTVPGTVVESSISVNSAEVTVDGSIASLNVAITDEYAGIFIEKLGGETDSIVGGAVSGIIVNTRCVVEPFVN